MKKIFLIHLLFSFACQLHAQYRFDNVKYKTVYYEDLCRTLAEHPGYLLLDVRSKGEYEDTSTYSSMNIGHIDKAINIDIRELPKRWKEISSYKNRPVFVYCSHSQRSRRASALLSDSGFTEIFNINGGLTNYRIRDNVVICNGIAIVFSLPFHYISAKKLSVTKTPWPYFVIDLRNDSSYKAISENAARNAFGRFRSSINIPFDVLNENLDKIPLNKEILLVDEEGDESVKAASILYKHGIARLNVLFDGIHSWTEEIPAEKRKGWTPSVTYNLINSYSLASMLDKGQDLMILDIRSADEFANKAKQSWKNIGNIKNAVNIPAKDIISNPALLNIDKNMPVVMYSFSEDDDLYRVAALLSKQGYKDVSVLLGGLFSFRWSAANIKGKSYLNQWVVNVPAPI